MSSTVLIDGDQSQTGIELRWYADRNAFVLVCDSPATGEAQAITIGLRAFSELTSWVKQSGITFADSCPTCGATFGQPCVSQPSGKRYGCDHAARRHVFPQMRG